MAENCGKRFIRTWSDIKKAPLTNQWSFPKVLVLLIALTLTFLIVASYVLTWDRKGLLLAVQPSQPSPAAVLTNSTTAAAAQVSSGKNLVDMKQLVKLISSKLEYPPRKVPDEKDVLGMDSRLSVIPRHFLPGIKNPCWYQEFSGDVRTDPYRQSFFRRRPDFKEATFGRLRTSFHKHLLHRDGKQFRLRCLPYFYTVGVQKCGTTDFHRRLLLHPEIRSNTIKEPHWWSRARFGYDGQDMTRLQTAVPVKDYLDLFDLAAQDIHEEISRDDRSSLITGDASATTLWDNRPWFYARRDREETGPPPFLTQDFIHAFQPDAKIIVILRDPVERLYSDYLYFKPVKSSVEDFHQGVVASVQMFQSCLSERSLRFCIYDAILFGAMPVRITLGMYVVYLLDWLTVFQREQILVVRSEDYSANIKETMKNAFDFLSVGPMSQQLEEKLIGKPKSNTRWQVTKKKGPMLRATSDILHEFYQPFNHKLASVLADEAFLWRNT